MVNSPKPSMLLSMLMNASGAELAPAACISCISVSPPPSKGGSLLALACSGVSSVGVGVVDVLSDFILCMGAGDSTMWVDDDGCRGSLARPARSRSLGVERRLSGASLARTWNSSGPAIDTFYIWDACHVLFTAF